MRTDLSPREISIMQSVRTAPLRPSENIFDVILIAEVRYPGFEVIRMLDRMSGDEEIIFERRF